MAWIRINSRNHTKEKPYLINSCFFHNWQGKKVNRVSNICVVCEWDTCWRNFCNFSLVTKKCESRPKIALFSNERHFEIWYPKKKTITFFWSKVSKLHTHTHTHTHTPPHTHKNNFACENYIFPKTRGNKNKQWTHSTPLECFLIYLFCFVFLSFGVFTNSNNIFMIRFHV